jgi:hypothetical protein
MKKFILGLLTAFTMMFPFSVQANAGYFNDISGSYAQSEIELLAENGIISGIGNGKFDPYSNLTRAQFAKMLALALELELDAANCRFIDVPTWAKPYVGALVKEGITKGKSSTIFGNNDFITREQMIVMYVRAMGVEEMMKEYGLSPTFDDSFMISPSAKSSVAFAQRIGFVEGHQNLVYPKEFAQRQAAARLLYEFTLNFDQYFEPYYLIVFEVQGVTEIAELIYMEKENWIKIYFEDGTFTFYDIENDEFFMLEMFEYIGQDWLALTQEEKIEFLFDMVGHWSSNEEINTRNGGVDIYDVMTKLNAHYANGGEVENALFDDIAYICIENGYFTWKE